MPCRGFGSMCALPYSLNALLSPCPLSSFLLTVISLLLSLFCQAFWLVQKLKLVLQGLIPNAFEAQIKADTTVFSRLFSRKKDNPPAADLTTTRASSASKGKIFSMYKRVVLHFCAALIILICAGSVTTSATKRMHHVAAKTSGIASCGFGSAMPALS